MQFASRGAKITKNPVHIHATIMYLPGFDHEKLTDHCSGRDYRLTGLAGNVIYDVIADPTAAFSSS